MTEPQSPIARLREIVEASGPPLVLSEPPDSGIYTAVTLGYGELEARQRSIVLADKLLRLVADEGTVEGLAKAVEFAIYRNADCSARDAERAAPFVARAVLAFLAEEALKEQAG